jgi:hypothetical protein
MITLQTETVDLLVTSQMDLSSAPISDFTHCFLNITLYTPGGALYTPTGSEVGSLTVSVKMVGSPYYELPPVSVIDANAMATLTWSGNTSDIRVVADLAADTGIGFFSAVVTANRT